MGSPDEADDFGSAKRRAVWKVDRKPGETEEAHRAREAASKTIWEALRKRITRAANGSASGTTRGTSSVGQGRLGQPSEPAGTPTGTRFLDKDSSAFSQTSDQSGTNVSQDLSQNVSQIVSHVSHASPGPFRGPEGGSRGTPATSHVGQGQGTSEEMGQNLGDDVGQNPPEPVGEGKATNVVRMADYAKVEALQKGLIDAVAAVVQDAEERRAAEFRRFTADVVDVVRHAAARCDDAANYSEAVYVRLDRHLRALGLIEVDPEGAPRGAEMELQAVREAEQAVSDAVLPQVTDERAVPADADVVAAARAKLATKMNACVSAYTDPWTKAWADVLADKGITPSLNDGDTGLLAQAADVLEEALSQTEQPGADDMGYAFRQLIGWFIGGSKGASPTDLLVAMSEKTWLHEYVGYVAFDLAQLRKARTA